MRLLAAIRVALVIALTALVLAIAALAYVVCFEAIRAFAIETAAFPPELAWSAPLLVDSFTTAASLVILWRYLRGDAWRDPWYAWTLVAAATAVSVALNVAHAPDRLAAQLFAALPPVALLGALELLMSVARTGLPHTSRTPAPTVGAAAAGAALDPTASGNGHRTPTALALPPQDRTAECGPGPSGRTGCAAAGAGAGRPRTLRRPPGHRGRGDRRHRPQPPPRLRAAPRRPHRAGVSGDERARHLPHLPGLRPPLRPARRPGPQAPLLLRRLQTSRLPRAQARLASRPASEPRTTPAAAPAKSSPPGS